MLSHTLLAALGCAIASARIVDVQVRGAVFVPDVIHADIGDIVEFSFLDGNHSVVRSDFASPCIPYQGIDGFYSGFLPGSETDAPKFQVTIAELAPIVFYCSQGQHCAKGMAGAINADRDALANYTCKAKNSPSAVTPVSGSFGGIVIGGPDPDPNPNPNPKATTTPAAGYGPPSHAPLPPSPPASIIPPGSPIPIPVPIPLTIPTTLTTGTVPPTGATPSPSAYGPGPGPGPNGGTSPSTPTNGASTSTGAPDAGGIPPGPATPNPNAPAPAGTSGGTPGGTPAGEPAPPATTGAPQPPATTVVTPHRSPGSATHSATTAPPHGTGVPTTDAAAAVGNFLVRAVLVAVVGMLAAQAMF